MRDWMTPDQWAVTVTVAVGALLVLAGLVNALTSRGRR